MIYKHAFCCKITKNSKGGPFGDIKIFSKKSRTVPKKIKRGDPLASAGFLGYVKKVKNERGDPLETKKISKKSRTVPKNVKGGPLTLWDLLTYIQLQNMKKTRRGDPFETLKFFRKKVAQCRKKIQRGTL